MAAEFWPSYIFWDLIRELGTWKFVKGTWLSCDQQQEDEKSDAEEQAATNVGTFELVDGTQVLDSCASSLSFEDFPLPSPVSSSFSIVHGFCFCTDQTGHSVHCWRLHTANHIHWLYVWTWQSLLLLAAIGSYVGSEWDLLNMSCSCGVNGSITFYLFEVMANVVCPCDFGFLSLPSASAVSCLWWLWNGTRMIHQHWCGDAHGHLLLGMKRFVLCLFFPLDSVVIPSLEMFDCPSLLSSEVISFLS
jgi:hypothetical protein